MRKNIFVASSVSLFAAALGVATAQEKKTAASFNPTLDYKAERKAAEAKFIETLKTDAKELTDKGGKLQGATITMNGGGFFSAQPTEWKDAGNGMQRATKFDERSGRTFVFFQPTKDRDGNTNVIARMIYVDDKADVRVGNEGVWIENQGQAVRIDAKGTDKKGEASIARAKELFQQTLKDVVAKDSNDERDNRSVAAARGVNRWNKEKYVQNDPTIILAYQTKKGDVTEKSVYLVELSAMDPAETNPKKKDRPAGSLHAVVIFELKKDPEVQFIYFLEPGEYG